MKRVYKMNVSLNCIINKSILDFAQGDLNTNFLRIELAKDVDLTSQMTINYILPNKEVVTEKINKLTKNFEVMIPNNVIKFIGVIKIEISFLLNNKILTIPHHGQFEIFKTINGQDIKTIGGETIKNELHQVLSSVDDLNKECKKKS